MCEWFISYNVWWCVFCTCQHVNTRYMTGFCTWEYVHILPKMLKIHLCVRVMMPWLVLYVLLCPLLFTLQPKHYQAKRITSVLSSNHGLAYISTQNYQSPLSSPLLWPSLNVRLLLRVIYRTDKTWMYQIQERTKQTFTQGKTAVTLNLN